MEARSRYNEKVGFNLHGQAHTHAHDAVDNIRQSNTFKSNINFKAK